MIRTMALTYAAVTLRLWTGVLMGVQRPFPHRRPGERGVQNAYAAVPFLCWLPNLLVAEWLVRRRDLPSVRLVTPT